MRIALLNCYLQGGHTENAEVESAARFAEAARRLGIEAKVFARSEDLAAFAPDFVLSLSYNDAKLTGFPTYVLLTAPPRWFGNRPRFVRNVLSYDGYWTLSPSAARSAGALFAKAGKPDLGAVAAISYMRTDFVPLDFSRAVAAYLGTNWDGQRHRALFGALAPMGVARFYGKRERWSHLPHTAFGGEVAFDGIAVLEAYRAAGIGLCLNHPDFDADGIPTSRVFEVPAASALMIAGRNQLVQEAFGDAALYVDGEGPPADAAAAIKDHVEWVRAHPKRALEMAEAAHRVFNERFALEAFLANAQEMHRRARATLGFAPQDAPGRDDFAVTAVIVVRDETVARFERCLDSVLAQTLAPRRVIVLDAAGGERIAAALRTRPCARSIEHRRAPGSKGLGAALARMGPGLSTEWVCCLSADEVLYPNHLFAAAEAARRHRAAHGGTAPGIVYSGMAQISETAQLPELMNDRYNVPRAEHMRLAQFDFRPAWALTLRPPLHPASCTVHVPTLTAAMRRRALTHLFPAALTPLLRALARSGGAVFTAAVTLATSSARAYSSYGRFAPPHG